MSFSFGTAEGTSPFGFGSRSNLLGSNAPVRVFMPTFDQYRTIKSKLSRVPTEDLHNYDNLQVQFHDYILCYNNGNIAINGSNCKKCVIRYDLNDNLKLMSNSFPYAELDNIVEMILIAFVSDLRT